MLNSCRIHVKFMLNHVEFMLSTQFFLVPFLPKYNFPHFHKLHAIREVNLWTFLFACIVQWFKNASQFKYQTADQCTGALVKKRQWESIVLYAFLATEEVKSPSANGATLSSICLAFTTCKHLWTCCYTPGLWYRRTFCKPISTCTLKGQTSAKQLNTWSSRLIHGNLLGSWGHQLLW